MNDQNIYFGYTPLLKTRKTEKGKSIDFDECLIFFSSIDPFLLREYNLFSHDRKRKMDT